MAVRWVGFFSARKEVWNDSADRVIDGFDVGSDHAIKVGLGYFDRRLRNQAVSGDRDNERQSTQASLTSILCTAPAWLTTMSTFPKALIQASTAFFQSSSFVASA